MILQIINSALKSLILVDSVLDKNAKYDFGIVEMNDKARIFGDDISNRFSTAKTYLKTEIILLSLIPHVLYVLLS